MHAEYSFETPRFPHLRCKYQPVSPLTVWPYRAGAKAGEKRPEETLNPVTPSKGIEPRGA